MVILNTEVETERKPDYPWEEAAYCVCSRVLEQEGFPYDGEVELLLTTPGEIRAMNREHRNTDRVTDVLSFPMLDYEEGPADFSVVEGMELMYEDPETGAIMLGDIVINLDRVREQAESYGHSELREFAFLVAHSMLHLCGYDHMTPEEAAVMEQKQDQVLRAIGITREASTEEQIRSLSQYRQQLNREV